jgi:hypothetical protein
VWFTRDQSKSMTATKRVSRKGNRTDACRILAEKAEGAGGCYGDYFGCLGLDGRLKMDVGEIHCEAAEWTELSRVMVISTSCESSYKSSGSQMTVRF